MPHKVDIIDLCPRFLGFHERATQEDLNPDARWALWEETYGFAAVPPTPAGREMARRLLNEAWDKYPAALEQIRQGAAALTPDPLDALRAVAAHLECDTPIHMQVIAFVGGFDANPFVFAIDGVTTLALPVEQEMEQRTLHLPHEMTHIVHAANAGVLPAWERSVAQLVLEEGLATRVTEKLVPDRTPAEYTDERAPGWFEHCETESTSILTDIRSNLEASTSEAITRYTLAPGPSGLTRTAYYAGWKIVGALTNTGSTLPALAKVSAERMPEIVRAGIDLLITKPATR